MSSPSPRRIRPLLIVEAANPKLTSAALVGWSCATAIAKETDAHLVTHWRNRDDFLAAGLVEDRDFTAIDTRRTQHLAWRITKSLSQRGTFSWSLYSAFSNLVYPVFERALWRHFESRLRAGEFDLVHRILPLSPTTTSPLAARLKRIGVPFVLGPLNGGVPWPAGFDHLRREEKDRGGLLRPLYQLLPGIHATRRNAAAILAGSRSTSREIPTDLLDRVFPMPENAIDPSRFPLDPRPPRKPGPLRVAFVGRLVALKGVDMLIEAALPFIKAGTLSLDLIGDGPARPALEERIRAAGLDPAPLLPGWVDHAVLPNRLREADLFVFPSVREFGGGAVLEAMALGVPPVVLHHGGPPELVPPGTGIILPMEDRAGIVRRLGDLFRTYVADPSPLAAMGVAAQDHIRTHLTWEAKARQIVAIYRWILEPGSPRPDWGDPLGWPAGVWPGDAAAP